LKIFIIFFPILFLFASNYENTALNLHLYNKSYWKYLLYFDGDKSRIKEKKFFLSPNGYKNPKSELIYTIRYFIKTKNRCKYPLRYEWLNKYLHFNFNTKCKIDKLINSIKNLKFVFASYKYNSAGSIFGHTFLKIETTKGNYAINFAAKIPKSDGLFKYIYSGISGKYISRFKKMNYSFKDIEYRNEEFRDIYEFKLNLSKQEIKNIIYFLDELKNTTFSYYYFDKNCASEMIRILDAKDENSTLRKDLKNITLPLDDIYILKKHHLIENIVLKESALRQFYTAYNKLNRKQKEKLEKYFKNQISTQDLIANEKDYTNLVQSALKYMEIKTTLNQKFSITYTTKTINLYMLNIKLPKSQKKIKKFPFSNKYQKILLGYNLNKHKMVFGYRFLYRTKFDLLDNAKGGVSFLSFKAEKNRLESFTFLDLVAEPLSNQFFFFPNKEIKIGIKRKFKNKKMYGYFDYDYGLTYQLNQYFNIKPELDSGIYIQNNGLLYLGSKISLEYHNNKILALLSTSFGKYFSKTYQEKYTLGVYYQIRKAFNIYYETSKIINNYKKIDNILGFTYLF
jgi:hypothetical protein